MTMQTVPTDAPDLAAARRELLKLARTDPANFAEYVMRDEMTGKAIKLASFHEQWHELFDKHRRLVLWAGVEMGKSSTLVGRLLFELGRDPSLRCAIVSSTHGQAVKLVGSVSRYIAQSAELKQVFPRLRRGGKWCDDSITVVRPTTAKDPSLQAYGVHGAVLGSRVDLLILDDVLSWENARTESQRQALHDWVSSTLLGRLTDRGRVVVVGTAFNTDDLPHRLARSGWPNFRFGVVDEDGSPRWPARWPAERIERKRAELGPYESARQLDTVATSDAEAVLQREWVEHAIARGAGLRPIHYMPTLSPESWISVGVDLGIGLTSRHDPSAIVAVLASTDGTRRVISVEAGAWNIDEIVKRIVDAHRRYCQARVTIETVQAQAWVAQLVEGQVGKGKIEGYVTGAGARSMQAQAELLGAEMSRGAWVIPSGESGKELAPELRKLVSEMIAFSPGSHTGDRLAALLLAAHGARKGAARVEVGRVNWHLR